MALQVHSTRTVGFDGLLCLGSASLWLTFAPLTRAVAAEQYASSVLAYSSGSGAANGYINPQSALGSPARMTGGLVFPSAVTQFNPAFMPSEAVSIGSGGYLVLGFEPPITDNPSNPFGIDLIVFGNGMFTDADFPLGIASALTNEGGMIELSEDGVTWISVPGSADGGWPTRGFMDCTPYSLTAGSVPTDFQQPIDPSVSPDSVGGLPYEMLQTIYGTSGGGLPLDFTPTGLLQVRAIRFSAAPGSSGNFEIDAVAVTAPHGSPADLDHDGTVAGSDLAILLSAWASPSPTADLDGDGLVGGGDLSLLIAQWTA